MKIDFKHSPSRSSSRGELVSITVTKEDYERLKASGGLHSDYVVPALWYYLKLMRETSWRPQANSFGWGRSPVVSFPCAIPVDLLEEMRNLPRRFDGHTIEAIHLFFYDEAVASNKISQEFRAGPTWRRSLASATFGALGLLVWRILGQAPLP